MDANDEPRVEEESVQEADVDDGEETSQGWSSPFGDLQELVEDLVDGFRGLSPTAYVRYPRMEMAATDDSYIVWMDLPGVDSDDLQVSALGDELTVSGHRRRPEYPEGARVRRSERSYGSFRRIVRLPADVNGEGIRARLVAGVLRIILPRRVDAEGRTIEVETDSD